MYKWSKIEGYEVSSKGDKRFSAFYARLPDGRTIEEHYQCDIKGYDPGGTNWKLGKGKPPLKPLTHIALWKEYLNLWRIYIENNPELLEKLKQHAVLKDSFATSNINQARALCFLLNEKYCR